MAGLSIVTTADGPSDDETTVNPGILKWFEDRGIGLETVLRTGIYSGKHHRVGDSFEVRPDPLGNVIVYPYKRHGQTVNEKYRSAPKKFYQKPNGQKIFWNADILDDPSLHDGSNALVIVEGECFPPDAEVLTPNGWVRFDQYDGEMVLQVTQTGVGGFVNPISIVKKEYTGPLIRYQGRDWVSETTPNHNLVGEDKNGRWRKFTAASGPLSSSDLLPSTTMVDGNGLGLSSNQISLCLAVSADAAIDLRKNGNRYARMSLLKKRKVDRIRAILTGLEVNFAETVQPSLPDFTFFGFTIPDWVPGRILPMAWIASATKDEREFILEEMVRWDGNSVPNRNQSEYSTVKPENAAFMQTMAHTTGRCSTIMRRSNAIGDWLKVSVLHGKQHRTWQKWKDRQTERMYSGLVYCLQVPSGYLLIRQEDKIMITGNCDALAVMEAGYPFVVSVPDGAPPPRKGPLADIDPDHDDKFSYVFEAWEDLKKIKQIIIAVDADEPGNRLAEELVRRLGKVRCRFVTLPPDAKDLNDLLLSYGPTEVLDAIKHARPYPVSGLYTLNTLPPEPDLEPMSTGWGRLDPLIRLIYPCLLVVTGKANSGKSIFSNQMVAQMVLEQGIKVGIASFEMRIKPFIINTFQGVYREARVGGDVDQWMNDNFVFICPEPGEDNDSYDIQWLLDLAAAAVIRHGIRILLIDPWNEIEHAYNNKENQTDYIGRAIRAMKRFAKMYEVIVILVAHPSKSGASKRIEDMDLYDVSDSQHWANKADFGIVVSRIDNSYETIIKVVKIRYEILTGMKGMCPLTYDPQDRIFSQ